MDYFLTDFYEGHVTENGLKYQFWDDFLSNHSSLLKNNAHNAI